MTYHTYGSENMIADYRKYLKLLDRSDTEINGVKKLLKYCETNNIDFMGMDYDSFQDFFLELKTNSKAKNSFNASMFNVRGFYKFLIESKKVDKSILDVLKLFKPYAVEHKIKSYVTKEELAEIVHMSETFCSYMDVTKIKALLYFMFFTGMRRGEILRLKREQIDLEKRTVLVKTPTKNKMERIIPIPKVIEKTKFSKSFNFVEMLKEYFATEGENKNAFNMSEANFDFFFKQIKEYAPEKNITPHTLRHSFARMLARKGIDSRIAQKLLGHKDIATTMIYYDPDIDTIHDIYDEKVK